MPTLLTRFSELILTIYDAAVTAPAPQFQDAALEALKRCVPFDSSMWGTGTMREGGIDIHSVHLHNSSPAMLAAYAQVQALDCAAERVTAAPTLTLAFNADTDFPGPERQPFRDFLHRFGHRNVMITSDIHPYTNFAHWVSLYRRAADAYCSEEEREFLGRLAPHLMQALSINRLLYAEDYVRDPSRQRWAVAVIDARGIPYHVGEPFLALLERDYPVSRGAPFPRNLVDAVLATERLVSKQIVICRKFESGMLFLKARLLEPVDSLSERELSVARLLASGLSKKEVAQVLDRSPDTISTQVKSIFAKLGISTVTLLPQHLAVWE